jgi:hypothetical protein
MGQQRQEWLNKGKLFKIRPGELEPAVLSKDG